MLVIAGAKATLSDLGVLRPLKHLIWASRVPFLVLNCALIVGRPTFRSTAAAGLVEARPLPRTMGRSVFIELWPSTGTALLVPVG